MAIGSTVELKHQKKQCPRTPSVLLQPVIIGLFLLMTNLAVRVFPAHEPITTKLTFNKEIVQIFQRNCTACHRPKGPAPMSLLTYDEARPWAKAIKEEVLEKHMPPWPVVKGYGEFINAPSLTQSEIDQIVNWVDGGAPLGEMKYAQKGPDMDKEWPLGQPDAVIRFTTMSVVESTLAKERVLFARTNDHEQWLKAIDLNAGTGGKLKQATFYLSPLPLDHELKSLRSRQHETLQTLIGRNHLTLLGTWLPGQKAIALPDEINLHLPAGCSILIDLQYHEEIEPLAEGAALGLYFSGDKSFRKAMGETRTPVRFIAQPRSLKADYLFKRDVEVIALHPLTDPRLESLQATAYLPGGAVKILIWTRPSTLDVRPIFYFKEPIILPKWTRVEVLARFHQGRGRAASHPSTDKRGGVISPDALCTFIYADSKLTGANVTDVKQKSPTPGAENVSTHTCAWCQTEEKKTDIPKAQATTETPEEYTCPMHPDVRSSKTGYCPKCGMQLVSAVPATEGEYQLRFVNSPASITAGRKMRFEFVILHPVTGFRVKDFTLIHDKFVHLFIVCQDMQHFQHLHPELKNDGTFIVETTLPHTGHFIIYADFYPVGGTPQVLKTTLTTDNFHPDLFISQARLTPEKVFTKTIDGVVINLRLIPLNLIAGRVTSLEYHLSDARSGEAITDLTPYLGAWGHTIILSEDLNDYVHSHPPKNLPTLSDSKSILGGPDIKFEALLPRPGNYRIWSQFKRGEKIMTVSFNVKAISFYDTY